MAFEHVEERKNRGLSNEDAANQTSIELAQCAEAHCRAYLVQCAYEKTRNIDNTLSPELAAVIKQLTELYAIDTCLKLLGDLLRVS